MPVWLRSRSCAGTERRGSAYALYVGDTGPDEVERCANLRQLWQAVAPLVRQAKLWGLFAEISYLDVRDVSQLYG